MYATLLNTSCSMRAALILTLFSGLILLTITSDTEVEAAQLDQCRRRVRADCASSGRRCIRHGRSNLCELRSNNCQMRLDNCGSQSTRGIYQRVNIQLCAGMKVNDKQPCGSKGNSNSNSNNDTPIYYTA